MKIRDVLDYVIELQEPAFSETVLLRWLNQVEAEIQTEVLLLAVDGIVQYSAEDLKAESNTELIVPAPFSKLYEDYLLWRIALGQGEAERANNLETIYHDSYLAYVRFVCGTIDPGSGKAEQMRYYLTAYQIAVKLGFAGSEEEWIASLKGDDGEIGAGLEITDQVLTEEELPVLTSSMSDIGKAYLVGEGAGALLYIWNGTEWFYKQPLSVAGPQGETGETGAQGPAGKDGVSVESVVFKGTTAAGNVYTIILSDKTTYEFTAPSGPVGPTGPGGSGVEVTYDAEDGNVVLTNKEAGEGGEGIAGVGIYSIAFKESTAAGNTYTITLTDGSTYDFTAPAGPSGQNGSPGKNGTSVTVSRVSESTADSGTNVVTFSDGKTLNVKNGSKGNPGYTPVKGVDYFTDADKEELLEDLQGSGGQRLVVTFTEVYNEAEDIYELTTDSDFEEAFNAACNGEGVVAKLVSYGEDYTEETMLDLSSVTTPSSETELKWLEFAKVNAWSIGSIWWSETGEIGSEWTSPVTEDVVGEPGGIATLDWSGKLSDNQNPMALETFTAKATGASGAVYDVRAFKSGKLVFLDIVIESNGHNPMLDEVELNGFPPGRNDAMYAWFPVVGVTATTGAGGCCGALILTGTTDRLSFEIRTDSNYQTNSYYYVQGFYVAE